MPKYILKKQDAAAGVFDMLPMVLVIAVVGYLMIFVAKNVAFLQKVGQLENIASKYILYMQSTNGLSVDDQSRLYQELSQYGYEYWQIDLSGTDYREEQIQYGDSIRFQLTVKVPCNGTFKEVVVSKQVIALGI